MEWERLEVEVFGGDLECADTQARSSAPLCGQDVEQWCPVCGLVDAGGFQQRCGAASYCQGKVPVVLVYQSRGCDSRGCLCGPMRSTLLVAGWHLQPISGWGSWVQHLLEPRVSCTKGDSATGRTTAPATWRPSAASAAAATTATRPAAARAGCACPVTRPRLPPRAPRAGGPRGAWGAAGWGDPGARSAGGSLKPSATLAAERRGRPTMRRWYSRSGQPNIQPVVLVTNVLSACG